MNDLSLWIYIYSVAIKLSITISVFLSIFLGGYFFVLLLSSVDESDLYHRLLKSSKLAIAASFIAFCVISLIPDKDAFYMIMGSEAGDYIASTDEAKQLKDDLLKIINKMANEDQL